MTLRLQPVPGLRIAATGEATPASLAAAHATGGAAHGAPHGIGGEFAGRELTNAEACRAILGEGWQQALAARGWTLEHVADTWGVRRRSFVADPGRPAPSGAPDSVDLALAAARAALAAWGQGGAGAGAAPGVPDIDALIVASATPPRATASMAGRVGRELGVRGACFDVRAGGAGGLMALATATGLLAQGARAALVVAAETPSRWLDVREPALALIYGDGAAAVLLVRDEADAAGAANAASTTGGANASTRGLLGGLLLNRPYEGRAMTVPGPLPPTAEALAAGQYRMSAPDRAYLQSLRRVREELLGAVRLTWPHEVETLTHFLPAAATAAQAREDAAVLGVPDDRVLTALAERGALGTAAPLAALHAWHAGTHPAAPGGAGAPAGRSATLLLSAVGGGISGVALLWRT